MHLVIDCDDVLRDFVGSVVKTYNKQNNTTKSIDDITDWNISQCLNIPNFYEYLMKNQTEILLFADPLPNAVETMKAFKENNYKVSIVTHQFKGTEGLTIGWLDKHQIPYDNLCFLKDKYLIRGDVIVDDKISNVMKFGIHNHPSLNLLVNRPWNQVMPPYIGSDGVEKYVSSIRVRGIKGAFNVISGYLK